METERRPDRERYADAMMDLMQESARRCGAGVEIRITEAMTWQAMERAGLCGACGGGVGEPNDKGETCTCHIYPESVRAAEAELDRGERVTLEEAESDG